MLHTREARPRLAIGQSTPGEKAPLAGVARRIFLRHHFVIGVCLVQTITSWRGTFLLLHDQQVLKQAPSAFLGVYHTVTALMIMHAPEVVIQLQNDLGRYLARTTWVVISLVPPYVTMCKVYCQVTLLWKNEERARRGQCQLTVQMNDWDIRTTTSLGLTCLWVSFWQKKKKNSENGKKKKKKKKTAWTDWGTLAVFAMLSSFPGCNTSLLIEGKGGRNTRNCSLL